MSVCDASFDCRSGPQADAVPCTAGERWCYRPGDTGRRTSCEDGEHEWSYAEFKIAWDLSFVPRSADGRVKLAAALRGRGVRVPEALLASLVEDRR